MGVSRIGVVSLKHAHAIQPTINIRQSNFEIKIKKIFTNTDF